MTKSCYLSHVMIWVCNNKLSFLKQLSYQNLQIDLSSKKAQLLQSFGLTAMTMQFLHMKHADGIY